MPCLLFNPEYCDLPNIGTTLSISLPPFGNRYRTESYPVSEPAVRYLVGKHESDLYLGLEFFLRKQNILKVFSCVQSYEIFRQVYMGSDRRNRQVQAARRLALDYKDYMKAARIILSDDWSRSQIALMDEDEEYETFDLQPEHFDEVANLIWNAFPAQPFDGKVRYDLVSERQPKFMYDRYGSLVPVYTIEQFTLFLCTSPFGRRSTLNRHLANRNQQDVVSGTFDYVDNLADTIISMVKDSWNLNWKSDARYTRTEVLNKRVIDFDRNGKATNSYFPLTRFGVQLGARISFGGVTSEVLDRLLYDGESGSPNRIDYRD